MHYDQHTAALPIALRHSITYPASAPNQTHAAEANPPGLPFLSKHSQVPSGQYLEAAVTISAVTIITAALAVLDPLHVAKFLKTCAVYRPYNRVA